MIQLSIPGRRPGRGAGLLLGALALTACREAEPETVPLMVLLERAPDTVLEQLGRLDGGDLSTGESFWSAGSNWLRAAVPGHGEVAFSRARTAWLRISALAPVDRTVRLELCTPGGDRPDAEIADRATVELNGFPLGEVVLGREPRTFELDAPSALWREGENVIQIQSDAPHPLDAAQGSALVGWGLVSLEYDVTRRVAVDPDDGFAVLADRTGLQYLVQWPEGAQLAIGGRADGEGELSLGFGTLDPATGAIRVERLGAEAVVAEDGRVAAQIDLPPCGGEVGTLTARWYSDEGAELTVERFSVVGDERPERPSVLFISIDTLSARHLSVYGYPRPTSPTLEALARDGVLFERCVANAPWTVHSYTSQFTGLFPRAHERYIDAQRRDPNIYEQFGLAPNRWTIAEALRSAGYETAAWVDNPWLEPELGLDQGFELFDRSMVDIPLWDTTGGIEGVNAAFLEWFDDRSDDRPFFAFLQALDPHAPYVVSDEYAELFADDDLYDREHELPVGVGQIHSFRVIPEHVARAEVREGDLPPRMATRQFVDAYDRKVRHVDDALGELFAALRRRGVLDDLLIVVSSDHGESLLTHEFYFDHATLFDETLHVPLIVRLPGRAQAGRRVAEAVQLVDLYPTLLDLVGLPTYEFLRGRSLAGAIEGAELEPVPLWSEGGFGRQSAIEYDGWKLIQTDARWTSPQTKVRHRRIPAGWLEEHAPELAGKMMSSAEIEAWRSENPAVWRELTKFLALDFDLYDLEEDPLEQRDRSGEARAKQEELLLLAASILGAIEEDRRRAVEVTTFEPLSPGRRAQLEELGYLERE